MIYYFGVWDRAGHHLWLPGGYSANSYASVVMYGPQKTHIDGSLAPRRHRRTGALVWSGQGGASEKCDRIQYDSEECNQGEFLRHELDNGFTAIQWWDRNQGDTRGACNSTILCEGKHDSGAMLNALAVSFPQVFGKLNAARVMLVDVGEKL